MNKNHLLIIDDEAGIRDFFREVAEELGFDVTEADGASPIQSAFSEAEPTVILLDLTMPGMDGIELLRDLAAEKCDAAIILASGQDERVLATALRIGRTLGLDMCDPLPKPVSINQLEAALLASRRESDAVTPETIRHAIDANQLCLHFQPKIDLQSGDQLDVIGSEALVRWIHPDKGMIAPGKFIPLAEECDLIGAITDVVIDKAIAQLLAWREININLPISINLSPLQLTDLSLPDTITAKLNAADLDPGLIVAEVTEQAAMADISKATDILTRLRLKQISVSLDDFGAGYSSLVEIYRLPLSELKFDRSMIMDIDQDADARKVVKALVALSHSLNVPVCAEGIETLETAVFLRDIGCDIAQGFLFAKPMPPDEFVSFLEDRPALAMPISMAEAARLASDRPFNNYP